MPLIPFKPVYLEIKKNEKLVTQDEDYGELSKQTLSVAILPVKVALP
jgi:hypothetical protein